MSRIEVLGKILPQRLPIVAVIERHITPSFRCPAKTIPFVSDPRESHSPSFRSADRWASPFTICVQVFPASCVRQISGMFGAATAVPPVHPVHLLLARKRTPC